MKIDLSALRKAIAQTEEAIALHCSDQVRLDERLSLHMRAATIQAFEFTYELSLKMLKRFLEATTQGDASSIDQMSFNELVRTGYEAGLLDGELVKWKAFRRDRGTTSHTYDETKAQEIFERIPSFLVEAKFLLQQIHNRQESRHD